MIPVTETFRMALRALRRNTLRSILTALGIIIGVAAVVAMVSIGEGAKGRIRSQIEGAGTNVILVFSGSSNSGGMRGGSGLRDGVGVGALLNAPAGLVASSSQVGAAAFLADTGSHALRAVSLAVAAKLTRA
jgi:putative ABC transport system permease protein